MNIYPVLLLLASSSLTMAATISNVGIASAIAGNNNDQVDQWRSTSQIKTFDPDGNNVYGTDGYVLYGTDTVDNGNAGSITSTDPLTASNTLKSIPSYVTLSSNGQNGVASSYNTYKLVDNPTLSVSTTVADVEAGAAYRFIGTNIETSMLNLTINSGVPTAFRLGIIAGLADSFTGSIRLAQTTGGSGTVSFVRQTGEGAIYFADIAGAQAGDVFTVFLTNTQGSAVTYDGITFDTVPEPSAALLGLAGFAFLAFLRKR